MLTYLSSPAEPKFTAGYDQFLPGHRLDICIQAHRKPVMSFLLLPLSPISHARLAQTYTTIKYQ